MIDIVEPCENCILVPLCANKEWSTVVYDCELMSSHIISIAESGIHTERHPSHYSKILKIKFPLYDKTGAFIR